MSLFIFEIEKMFMIKHKMAWVYSKIIISFNTL